MYNQSAAHSKQENLHVARIIKENFIEESKVESVLKDWRGEMVMSRDNINEGSEADTVILSSLSGTDGLELAW